MELVKYQKLESAIPIKAIPEQELNSILVDVFIEWLSDLLSLTDEVSANRLITALPAIKEHCWSMGFVEIKKMFEMYADNKLSIKPISNYFDRILFGKIIESYKQQKRTKPIQKDVDMEKEKQDYVNVIGWFDWFIQNRKVTKEMTWIYDYLILKDKEFTPKEKFRIDLVQQGIDEGMEITDAKAKVNRTLIKIYFERLEDKGIHIKSLI